MKRRFRALYYVCLLKHPICQTLLTCRKYPLDEYEVFEFADQEEVTEERRQLVETFRECGWHEEQQGDDDEGLGGRRAECFRRINPDYEVEEEEGEDK